MKQPMSTPMRVLIGAGICLTPILISILIFLTAGDVGVSGADAFKVSFHSIGYTIPFVLLTAGAMVLFYVAIKGDWQEDFKGVLAVFAIWIMLAVAVYSKPAGVKTDPIGSGLSTEDINYLRFKGYKR